MNTLGSSRTISITATTFSATITGCLWFIDSVFETLIICDLSKLNDKYICVFCVFFSGGAELLFNKVKKHDVSLPKGTNPCK